MTKKIFTGLIIASALLGLSGCGSDQEDKKNNIQNFTSYQNENIQIQIPVEWEIIEKNEFSDKVPENTIVVFRNNLKSDVFTSNINIRANPTPKEKTSIEHAKRIINEEKSGILNYEEIKRETISLKNRGKMDETEFIVFKGKRTHDEDQLIFTQTFLSTEDTVYIVTGAYKQKEDERVTSAVTTAVKSFVLK